MAFYPGQTG